MNARHDWRILQQIQWQENLSFEEPTGCSYRVVLFTQVEGVFIFTITRCRTLETTKIAKPHTGKIVHLLAWCYLESINTFVRADHLLRGFACLINRMSIVVRCTNAVHLSMGFSNEYLVCLMIYPGSTIATYRKHLQSEVALTLACNTFTRLWWAFIFHSAMVAGSWCH